MGNFTLKTDSYLNQFALFRGINKLLGPEGYQDTKLDKVPSLSQLLADKMYHEWIELAEIVADIDDWTEADWNNFNICMSLAESCKNRVDSISYALEGLGWNFKEGDKNEIITDANSTTIKIKVDNIDTPPRLDQIKAKLKRCIEYLILVKDPRLEFDIDIVNILAEFSADSTSSEVISTRYGILLDAETTQESTLITIHVYNTDTPPVEVNEISSYMIPSEQYPAGYYRYNVVVKDKDTGEVITDPSLYTIKATYQLTVPNLFADSMIIPTEGWEEDNYPVTSPNELPEPSWTMRIHTMAAHLTEPEESTILLTPASTEDELTMAEAEVFMSNLTEDSIYLRCTHIPLRPFRVNILTYITDKYEDYVIRDTVILNSNNWDSEEYSITVPVDGLVNTEDLVMMSNIPDDGIVPEDPADYTDIDWCNVWNVRIDSVGENTITFKCETLPTRNLTIPLEWLYFKGETYETPLPVNEDNPVPSAYFDKDEMVLWIAKGQGLMDYTQLYVNLIGTHIYGQEEAIDMVLIDWNENPPDSEE